MSARRPGRARARSSSAIRAPGSSPSTPRRACCALRVAGAAGFDPSRCVCADAVQLPFADASVDVAFSNLLLPWCDPDALFAELRRVLAPRGSSTLDRARTRHAAGSCAPPGRAADPHIRVGDFIDMHDVGDALVRAGFAAPVLDVERYTLRYADVHGAHGRSQGHGRAQCRRRAAQGPHLAAQARGHAGGLRSVSRGQAPSGHLRSRLRASLGTSRENAHELGAGCLARGAAGTARGEAPRVIVGIIPERGDGGWRNAPRSLAARERRGRRASLRPGRA